RLTAPLRGIQRQFERLSGLAKRIGVLGGAVAAISFMAPIQSAAAFEQKMRDTIVTAGYFAEAAEQRIRALSASLEELALKVGLTSNDLGDALNTLSTSGMEDGLANRLMPIIGRVAKAASAASVDVAKVGFALNNTLGIQADQMETAYARLIVAGKLGRFEFKNMAKVIPELAASLKGLGVTGMEAVSTLGAALQVAMFGTDSPDTAANNLKNFLGKVLAPDAIKKFQKMGVDIQGVMTDALKRGINPVEAALEKISKVTGTSQKEIDDIFKGAKASGMTDAQAAQEVKGRIQAVLGRTKLGQLFEDTQVLDFLVPFLLNKQKYLEFKKAIEDSGLDVIAKDFGTQMVGLQTQLTIFQEIVTQLNRRVGLAFGRNLPWINSGLMALLGWIKQVDAAFPGVIDKVLSFGGGALVLVTALGLLGPVFSVIAAGAGVIATGIGI
ncbi:phage tail tape measure protein, partial [Xanthobacter sp. DSM 24535]|uniref:phage tail tape measure protein n=1 Tax=Roseixanthobacter psychrophilus TaxID=3119917 RepID=UPI00372BE06D